MPKFYFNDVSEHLLNNGTFWGAVYYVWLGDLGKAAGKWGTPFISYFIFSYFLNLASSLFKFSGTPNCNYDFSPSID